jgi:hypothetical protein
MPHYLKAMQRCHGAIDFGDGSYGILSFAVGHEVEIRSTSERLDIGNAKEYNFIAT